MQFLPDLVSRAKEMVGCQRCWMHGVSEKYVCPPRSVTKAKIARNELDEVVVCEWSGAVLE
jgi:hypothetical protein